MSPIGKLERRLVVTIATGSIYTEIGKLTHFPMKEYASHVGAEFQVMDKINPEYPHPVWQKLELFNLLKKFDRILYVDTDVVIRPNAPNLFSLVPPEQLGALDETWVDPQNRLYITKRYFKENGFFLKDTASPSFDITFRYFNAGILVVSQIHRELFADPDGRYPTTLFLEQTYLNGRRWNLGIPLHDLRLEIHCFSGCSCADTSPFVHFTGDKGLALEDIRTKMTQWELTRHLA